MTGVVENWRYIPDTGQRYAVSNLGRVYSYVSNKLLRPGRMSGGHMSVALGRGNSRCVHELVLTSFVGPRPEGFDGRHGNGIPSDNRLDNLEWATRADNSRDKKWHNGQKGKLALAQVVNIKSRLKAGESQRGIARLLGVAGNTVWQIANERTHQDV